MRGKNASAARVMACVLFWVVPGFIILGLGATALKYSPFLLDELGQ